MLHCNHLQNATSFLGVSTNANPSHRNGLIAQFLVTLALDLTYTCNDFQKDAETC